MSAKNTVNLLPKGEFELSFWGRFLKWALSAGRYIIILTEMVVISAFFSRFYLDQKMSDLTDSVANKQLILNATVGLESNFRQVQARLKATRQMLESQINHDELVESVVRVRPAGVSLTSLQLGPERKMVIRAKARDESELGTFVTSLVNDVNPRGEKRWKNLNLTSVSFVNSAAEVQFTLAADY